MQPVQRIHQYPVQDRDGLRRVGQALRDLHEPPYTVTIHPYQVGLGAEQRALWKIWMTGLAAETGYTAREVENILLRRWGPWKEFINEDGELERRPARMNDREMSHAEARDLMTIVQAYFAEWGFTLQTRRHPTDPPAVVFDGGD